MWFFCSVFLNDLCRDLKRGNDPKQKTAREARCTICETIFVTIIHLVLANYMKTSKKKHKNMVNCEKISKTLTYGHHEKCVFCLWGFTLEFQNPQWKNVMHLSTLELALS